MNLAVGSFLMVLFFVLRFVKRMWMFGEDCCGGCVLLSVKKLLGLADLRARAEANQWCIDELKKAMLEHDHQTARLVSKVARSELFEVRCV